MRHSFIAGAIAAGVLAGSAQAGTVEIRPVTDNSRLTNVSLSFDGGTSFRGALAGQLEIERTGGTDTELTLTRFFTFCVEPTEFLAQTVMELMALEAGDTAQGGMGAGRAAQVSQLFARVLPGVHVQVADQIGAAIQLAVWEIVREDGGDYALDAGSFRASAPAGVAALAQGYLDLLTPKGPSVPGLKVLTREGAQDLLALVPPGDDDVPAPAMLALFGLGVAGLARGRRRR